MRLNWIAYNFMKFDGYGRYGLHYCRALQRLGLDVEPIIMSQLDLPSWMQRMAGLDFSRLTITCTPPYMLQAIPGRQWSLSMTEGTRIQPEWTEKLNQFCERVIVPCEHNKEAYGDSGVEIPIHILPGGTSPSEFPIIHRNGRVRPYTFLALGDRGARKGWVEVWQAFYKAFEMPADTPDVRLLLKTRPHTNDLIERICGACRDPRISFWMDDVGSMADVYAFADCFAIPSRSEGWGMPHREAAMMGLPVIATRYSGLDDGHLDKWAIPLTKMEAEPVPKQSLHMRGEWMRCDVDELAEAMRWCYNDPLSARAIGRKAAMWLRKHQTWMHSAKKLTRLIERYC
jgi:glycosyltransferase involved in cell wall biosynthesis